MRSKKKAPAARPRGPERVLRCYGKDDDGERCKNSRVFPGVSNTMLRAVVEMVGWTIEEKTGKVFCLGCSAERVLVKVTRIKLIRRRWRTLKRGRKTIREKSPKPRSLPRRS